MHRARFKNETRKQFYKVKLGMVQCGNREMYVYNDRRSVDDTGSRKETSKRKYMVEMNDAIEFI